MNGTAEAWKDVFEKHHATLLEALSSQFDSELGEAVQTAVSTERENADRRQDDLRKELGEALSQSVSKARLEALSEGKDIGQRLTAEALNQTIRRLKQASSEAATLNLLADATEPWAHKAVVLVLENNQASLLAARNLNERNLTFELEAAGAVQSVVDAQDPLVALASGREVSSQLAAAFADGEGEATPKAYLFPVTVRQNVVAMLIASGSVVPAPLEMLCEAASMKLEMLTIPPPRPASAGVISRPDLVQIDAPANGVSSGQSSDSSVPAREHPAWDELSSEDQQLHLRAQRVARVRVAELRLYRAEELRKGIFSGDIYGALQTAIDGARTDYLQNFLSKSPTMVDYLHLELLRSLAHDDDRLLGEEYPGPMV